MSHSRVTRTLAIAVVALAESLSPSSFAQNAPASVEEGFKNPPSSAQPRVWWHWMNGNITKEGIKLDLEWMNRVGIGGFQNFDALGFFGPAGLQRAGDGPRGRRRKDDRSPARGDENPHGTG